MRMNKTQISVIIPVYNGSEYIASCLDSIIYQNNSHQLEIIIVDDGSVDDTHDIVRRYQLKYPNISLLRQKNAGVSAARNNGIRAAHGKFVTFIDADDMVGAAPKFANQLYKTSIRKLHKNDVRIFRSPVINSKSRVILGRNYFTEMLNIAHQTNSDVVLGGKITHKQMLTTEYFTAHLYDRHITYDATPTEKAILLYQADLRESANAALYRRSFLRKNKLRFIDGMNLDEDILFCMLAVFKANRVSTAPDTIYVYNRHCNSLSNFNHSETTRSKYCIANIQRFSLLLTELSRSTKYAQNYNYWLKKFSELSNVYQERDENYPPSTCMACPYDKCDRCFQNETIKILIQKNIENFLPKR